MNKQDSLKFLQSCIDRIANASDEDVEMFQMKYDTHCIEPEKKFCTNMTKSFDLFSCPFCGSDQCKIDKCTNGYVVTCTKCHSSSGAYNSPELSVKAWNFRIKI